MIDKELTVRKTARGVYRVISTRWAGRWQMTEWTFYPALGAFPVGYRRTYFLKNQFIRVEGKDYTK